MENLRYKSCTDDDVKVLQSRVAGRGPNRPKLNQPNFRNVSVITAWNSYRDQINLMGSKRFAQENGQELTTFYSIDRFGDDSGKRMSKKQQKKVVNPQRKTNIVSEELQETLWDLDHHLTEHHAGKLSLCLGMPESGKTKTEMGNKGKDGIDLYELSRYILGSSEDIFEERLVCLRCQHSEVCSTSGDVVWTLTKKHWKNHPRKLGVSNKPISEWLKAASIQKSNRHCRQCNSGSLTLERHFTSSPMFMGVITHDINVQITSNLIHPDLNDLYRLCGVVYYHDFHFVCHIINKSGEIYYHDGQKLGTKVKYFNNVLNVSDTSLNKAGNYKSRLLIYTRI